MCDETDVENSLKSLIIGYLYPNGTSAACAAGVPVQVIRGWPTTNDFEYAKKQSLTGMPGLVVVSVCTRVGVERNTTRYPVNVWQTITGPVHTLTATVGGPQENQITIGGSVSTPQNVIAIVGGPSNQQVFAYAVQASDTINTVAAGLASLIAAKIPGTTSSGAVISVNSEWGVEARVAASGTVIQIVGQHVKEFQITIWAPPCNVSGQDADSWRTAVAKIIDPNLQAIDRIVMTDQVYACIKFERTVTIDAAQSRGLYRRDLFYNVEYSTTITQTAYEIGVMQAQITGGQTEVVGGDQSGIPTVDANY